LISELHKHGVNVPVDLSVVGFDGIDISKHYIPDLTTTRQPRIDLGARTAEMIMNRIQCSGSEFDVQRETFPVDLVVCSSTQKI